MVLAHHRLNMHRVFTCCAALGRYLATTKYERMYHANAGLTIYGSVLVVGCNDPVECPTSANVVEILVPPYKSPALKITGLQVGRRLVLLLLLQWQNGLEL